MHKNICTRFNKSYNLHKMEFDDYKCYKCRATWYWKTANKWENINNKQKVLMFYIGI